MTSTRIIALLPAAFLSHTHADVIDDFSVSALPKLEVTVPNQLPHQEKSVFSAYEFDQTILNDYRQLAIRSSSPGVTATEISGNKLIFSSTSNSGSLFLYNQAKGEPFDLDISHLFSGGLPVMRIDLDFEINDSTSGYLVFAIHSYMGYILVIKDIPTGVRQISHQIVSSEVPAGFKPSAVSSIRLFMSFHAPVSIAINRYELIAPNPNAVPVTGLAIHRSTPGYLSLASTRSIIGYRYALYRTSSLNRLVNQWELVESLPGTGGKLEWTFPAELYGPQQFFSLGVAPGL